MYVATTMEAYERRDVAERSDISPKRVPAPSDVSGASWPCPPPVSPTPRPRVDCLVDDEACLMTLTLPAAIK